MPIVDIQPYQPDDLEPPYEVRKVIESGRVEITRRAEFYEADAITRWYPDPNNPDVQRLIDGSVTVDYNSDERRKLDITFDNIDKLLRPNPNGGLWYDKVIKVFRGVKYDTHDVSPHYAIIESEASDIPAAMAYAALIGSTGFREPPDLQLGVTDAAALQEYSWIVSALSTSATAAAATLNTLWGKGKNIITFGVGNGAGQLPHYSSYLAPASLSFGIAKPTNDAPTSDVFAGGVSESEGTVTGVTPTGAAAGTLPLAVWSNGGSANIVTAAMRRNANGAVWIDIHLPNLNGSLAKKFLKAALSFVWNYYGTGTWEAQLGEFYIDNISEANFPDELKVVARDATKKMMNSKLARTASFTVGTVLQDFVTGQAALAGIPVSKMRFNMAGETLTTELSFDKGTSRWDMIKGALGSFNYEFFFDGRGYFVIRPFNDPTLSPIDFSFGTGPDGNLVDFEKAVNDSRIYNIVQVTAAPSDNADIPISYFGEARNDDPNSPTNTTRLGERVLPIDAPWLSTDEDCAALAAEYLKISALESYELNFHSIYYPWLEAGGIIEILDPDAFSFEPTRFLMDTIDYGLGLGPMQATGKRVTFVGQAN